MGPTTYQFSGAIGARVESVFALLTDPARFPDWLPGCRGAKGSGPLKKGARFAIQLRTPLRTREIQIEVIEFIPPNTFFKLQFGGGSTAVTMKHIWAPRGIGAWLRGAMFRRRQLEKQFDGALQKFRKILTR